MYHAFSRAICSPHYDMYVTTLTKIANYFFALNDPYYARWVKNDNCVFHLYQTDDRDNL